MKEYIEGANEGPEKDIIDDCGCGLESSDKWNVDDDEYEAALTAFIKRINSAITVGCALPFNIPVAEIRRIIDDAFRWFVREHEDYTYPESLIIPAHVFHKHMHRQGVENICTPKHDRLRGKILLPPETEYVDAVYDLSRNFGETGGSRYIGGLAYSIPQTYGLNTQFAVADAVEYYTCMLSFSDILRMMTVPPVSTTFNPITKVLHFTGHIPVGGVVLCVRTSIDKISAFSDDLFFRYCVIQCKIQLGEILERYNYTLPGNITVKSPADAARTDLSALIEEIRQYKSCAMIVM